MEILIEAEPEEKIRLNDFIIGRHPLIQTRSGAKKAIKSGMVLLNGNRTQPEIWLRTGQIITIADIEIKPRPPYKIVLEIIFEDNFLAVINKPAGIPVSGNQHRTIENALHFNLTPSNLPDALKYARAVHRLDAGTSGLLLIAKTVSVEIALKRQFEKHTIKKEYTALVSGCPDPMNGEIDLPVDGLKAISKYHVIDTSPNPKCGSLTLVSLEPFTGRTHQLRKHMASIGCPIVGDELYSEDKPVFHGKGLFLCATAIAFQHPSDNKQLQFEVPIPTKYAKLMDWGKRSMKNR